MRAANGGLGFRVKSGWSAVVLLTDPVSPRVRDSRIIDLCDPMFPETRQPYHAGMGKLEMNMQKVNRRVAVVRRIAQTAVAGLLAGYKQDGYVIRRATLVVGSQIDPASIANPHIRAHAFEGKLFRCVIEEALNAQHVRTDVLLERNIDAKAVAQLKRSNTNVRSAVQNLGRFTQGPWRADQKLAALAAWLAVS